MAEYQNDVGTATQGSPFPMFWQSAYTTNDGTLIEWGTGDHGGLSDNGVREYSPVSRTQTYVYANNNGSRDVSQYDNLQYWYIPRVDCLVIPSRGHYSRAQGRWLSGNMSPASGSGVRVVGTGANDLIYPDASVSMQFINGGSTVYNAHQAWSAQHDCGVFLGGSAGGGSGALPMIWVCVPTAGVRPGGSQPYTMSQRSMPQSVGGATPFKIGGRDGCCFLRDYVYWVGGGADGEGNTPHFFRMPIANLLTSTSAALQIERLPDAPAGFRFGLLRADPYIDALLCVTDRGIFAYDVPGRAWSVVTPSGYVADFTGGPMKGLLPYGTMGDFVDSSGGQSLRRFYFRPGVNHAWDYDFSTQYTDRMHKRFRSIRLGRR